MGLHVTYVYDTPSGTELRGTAGALRGALDLLGPTFWVVNGNTYLNIDYSAVTRYYHEHDLTNLVVVYRNENRHWLSNIELTNGIIQRYSKAAPTPSMQHIDAGVAILQATTLRDMPNITCLSTLYEHLVLSRRLAAYEVRQRFYETNTLESLRETTRYLRSQNHW